MNMKRKITLLILVVYLAAVILASAGAMNYAVTYGATFYLVGGILNLLFGGYVTYQIFKAGKK